MPKVSNLAIKLQTGSKEAYYASWDFKETVTSATAGSAGIKKGSLVSIASNATYYNGVAIPEWVKSDKWYIVQVEGSRAVLGQNASKTNNIQSPIDVKYLSTGSSSSGTTTTTTNYLDHFEVQWYYDTGDGIWFEGQSATPKTKYSIYSGVPENALRIKVKVTPVSTTYDSKDNSGNTTKIPHWDGTASEVEFPLHETQPPATPSVPSVTEPATNLSITMSVENISDERTDMIEFEVYDKDGFKHRVSVTVRDCRASYVYTLKEENEYRVRCRAIKLYGKNSKYYSEYSEFTDIIVTVPPAPSGAPELEAKSDTSVSIRWAAVSTATNYDIEYAESKEYFDGSDQTTTANTEFTNYLKTGLESGKTYYFRVRANNEGGSSKWSEIASVVLGKAPVAPTTWSSSTTVIAGEPLTLYWVHNSEDGSSQTTADLEIYVDGFKETHTIQNSTLEDEKDKTSFFVIDTSEYEEAVKEKDIKIEWRVRTKGVLPEYGDWSVPRVVNVYAQPTLALDMITTDGNPIETLNQFPFYISALPGPESQLPISYHLTIVSNDTYTTTDQIGNSKIVSQGEEVYSKYFDVTDALMVELSAGNIDLENSISYTATCRVAMNSGLTAESSLDFTVDWTDSIYEPNAEIGINTDVYSAVIRPYCVDDEGNLIEDAILSVYRREYDGSFTEIASGIPNIMSTYITDPHPSLDYARYRIVAISDSNGGVGFYDVSGQAIRCNAIIIQWDEEWSNFDTVSEDNREQPTWAGSFLKLIYNIDVSESNALDRTFVKYVGRTHPVTYYGTQVGETATWNTVIPKSDVDTIYALRRLAKWKGDVYVREPSGVGYWASISVSFSLKHSELTVPVSFSITRVEGGI